MKRFIRTENGVYELVDDKYIIKDNKLYEKEYFNNPFGDGSDEYIGEVLIGEILAKADTIEDLCDGFVYKDDTKLPHTFVGGNWTYEECKEWCSNEYESKDDYELYGAIWTSKGLIFIAKMNDDGDMVLI